MYVIDITRCDGLNNNDVMLGKDSMDAKSKTIKYITDYALANYNVYLDYNLLDQNLNMDGFSLKQFMKENYSIPIDHDLKIQSFPADKDCCLFVKLFDNSKDEMPILYAFEKSKIKDASTMLTFLVNDLLIEKYQDNLELYESQKLEYSQGLKMGYSSSDICCDIISLYNGGMFMEELLNNACSYNQLTNTINTINI